jgi:hypothetical protein
MSHRTRITLLAFMSVCACSGGGGAKAATKSNCLSATDASLADALMSQAVTPYVTNLDPLPKRFLYTEGGDSALGSVASQALNEHGPTYLLPAKESDQKRMKADLKSKAGSWITLLVSKGTVKQVDDSTAAVTMHGAYYWFGDKAGQSSAPKDIMFACRQVNGQYNWVPKNP